MKKEKNGKKKRKKNLFQLDKKLEPKDLFHEKYKLNSVYMNDLPSPSLYTIQLLSFFKKKRGKERKKERINCESGREVSEKQKRKREEREEKRKKKKT